MRLEDVMAKARSLPAWIWALAVESVVNSAGMWPAMVSATAGLPPL